ncbi:hypothetical protein FQN55_008478 [Onygenales sp. PD_40]|nr:hypothetical protein FQN55_008478 [Onygenales sp. PD_40]KAK2776122.1 hypothetical protein FQN53_002853 [Emmonsiellopsis sp. PD_33]KAK2788954.1 hypothetical protein FQN52_006487 [Onygenales sp. PD_12]
MAFKEEASSSSIKATDTTISPVAIPSSTSDAEKLPPAERRRRPYTDFLEESNLTTVSSGSSAIKPASDTTHRKLKPRHIQLIGIGGTIGTALYVQIGKGLMQGGPGSLFLAFTLW